MIPEKQRNPIKKWEKDLNSSPKKTYRWLTKHEKMFKVGDVEDEKKRCSRLEKCKSKLQ